MIEDLEDLEEVLSRPTPSVAEALSRATGDILVLGVGGKMGPSLARLARRAADAAGGPRRITGVSRFSQPGLQERLESWGIKTHSLDLFDPGALEGLPDAENVVFMVARKFGSTGSEPATWATNSFLPGALMQRFPRSRILTFSTGNVYPLTRVDSGGPREDHAPGPIGEYAQSCLARERVFEHFSRRNRTPVSLIRLNYAIDLRYGVLVDVGRKVLRGEPIDLSMGHVNVIWQGDACAQALSSLPLSDSPPFVLNVTGPEVVSIRSLAERLGKRLGREPLFEGKEEELSLLSNASLARELFGPPRVGLEEMIAWTADWLRRGGETYGKPTRYEVRDGRF